MKKKVLIALSYIATAIVTCGLTIFLIQRQIPSTKLITLENLILELFPNEVDRTEMEDAAADAMVAALGDRWSYYIPAREYDRLMESMENSFVGIGITLTDAQLTGSFQVQAVIPESPADQAGMQKDDVIIQVDGEAVEGLSLSDLSDRIRGEIGTQVSITLRRQEAVVTLNVTRNRINTVVAKGNLLDGTIGYVRIENFVARSAQETLAVIEDLISQGATKLILDVRFNSGGYEEELVKILDYLLPEGPLFRSVNYKGEEDVDYSDEDCLDIPMAVIINGDSYSAAEFFAAALQEYEAAVIVGTQTCGKANYQQTFRLSDGSAISISTGHYQTPNGVTLDGIGVTPDVIVEVDEKTYLDLYYEKVERADDAQLQAAISALHK